MKKSFFLSFVAALLFFGLSACTDCKECKVVSTVDGEVVDTSAPEEYCGEDLEAIDGTEVTVGDQTNKWVCE
jgi:hypothetical protein